MKSTSKILLIAAAFILLIGGIALWHFKTSQTLNLDEAPKGGDFTLQSANGPFNLKAQRGKVVLLYFGYTSCPDICPTNLARIAEAFKALKKNELARVEAVFISVDPQRDNLKKLAAYTKYFHPSIIGVTGTPGQLAKVARQYGAAYRKVKNASGNGYLIDHSSNTYVIAPDGTLNTTLPDASAPQEMVKLIRSLLSQ